MFTVFGFTDFTFILDYYYQIVSPVCTVNIQKSKSNQKQKSKTIPLSFKMKYEKNVTPAGMETDEEDYDEYGDFIEKKTYNLIPQEENFQLTLQYACENNNVAEIIRALNSSSININSYLNNSWTALMFASFNGSLDAITYLLKNGADPLITYDCHNVIMCVCNSKKGSDEDNLLKCLKLLTDFDNIDINSKDRAGLSALMYACSNGWLKIVEFLIDHGADVHAKDNMNGESALFFAVRSNHVDVVKCLLTHGVDKDTCDNKGQTVHRIAENKNMVDILNLLNLNYDETDVKVFYSEEVTYLNEVMAELENGFSKDVQIFLKNLSMNVCLSKCISNNITFKHLLTGNKDQLVDMGIVLTPHRKLFATALKCFHTCNWSNQIFDIKKNEINAENIAQTLAIIVRQLHIIDASIIYLGTQKRGLDPQKGKRAMQLLMNIQRTEDKIFKILDKQVRIGQVDYIGPHKYKNKNTKTNFKDKMFAATAVILIVLHLV